MNGSCFLFLLISLISFQSDAASNGKASAPQSNPQYEAHRQAAIQINDLAGRIHSEADARELTNTIAKMFAANLPPVWATQTIRDQIADAEYQTATDSSRLIPEQRIADVWNEYAREINAPDEALVTAAEIHNMRDADYAVAQMMWARGHQTIWMMPNVYAVGSNRKVADGCRAVETLRILHDIADLFGNVRAARERLKKGTVASDSMGKTQPKPTSAARGRLWLEDIPVTANNPTRDAEAAYIRERGSVAYYQLLEKLFSELFPAEPLQNAARQKNISGAKFQN